MSNVEYDLDTSSEIMKEIQKLISPPESEDSAKTKKREGMELHPYFRRPGKGHNHDSCDSCGEGGDLLCCDKCPASFHLECHDPPLEQTDIPMGQWICHKCKCKQEKTEEEEKKSKPKKKEEKKEKEDSKLSSRAKRAKSRATRKNVTKGAAIKTVLEYITKAATEMNPKQFELPPEMRVPVTFPGTDKVPGPSKVNSRRTSAARRKGESEGGVIVPRGVKQCFYCQIGCRKAPLIHCDYCTLLYHQDCLTPPLTSLPTGRWMCPAHGEFFLDQCVLKTCGVTERLRLWDDFSRPIDQDAIKIDFLRKVNRRNPPFNFKVRLPPRNTVRVPESVKESYKNPVDCVPSLQSDLQKMRSDRWRDSKISFLASEEEQDLFLSAVMVLYTGATKKKALENVENVQINQKANCDMNCQEALLNGCADENEKGEAVKNGVPDAVSPSESSEGSEESYRNSKGDEAMEVEPEYVPLCNGSISDPEEMVEEKPAIKNDQHINMTLISQSVSKSLPLSSGQSESPTIPDNVVVFDGTRSNVLVCGDLLKFLELYSVLPGEWDGGEAFSNMDEKMIRLLAFERLNQIRKQAREMRTIGNLSEDIDICKLDGTEFFKEERSSLKEDCVKQNKLLSMTDPLNSINSAIIQPGDTATPDGAGKEQFCRANSVLPKSSFCGNSEVKLSQAVQIPGAGKINAVITPLNALNRPVTFVAYKCITFGSGKHVDVDVSKYGFCNYISDKHATIFYDAVTHRHELINYSEHGTYVDMLWYSSTEKRKDHKSVPQSQFTKVVKEIEALQQKRFNLMSQPTHAFIPKESNSCPSQMDVRGCSVVLPLPTLERNQQKCLCELKPHTITNGWEGSARLNHGSLIRCGCVQFVFSVLPPDVAVCNSNQCMSQNKENVSDKESGELFSSCRS